MCLPLTLALYGSVGQAQDGDDPTQPIEVADTPEAESGEASASGEHVESAVPEVTEPEAPSTSDVATEPDELDETEPANEPSEASETSATEPVEATDVGETVPPAEGPELDDAPPSVEEPVDAESTTSAPPSSAPVPPRHTGEVRAPVFSAGRSWGLRPTAVLRAGDLLGFGSLVDPSYAVGSPFGPDDPRRSELAFDGHLVAYGRLPSLWDDISFDLAFVTRVTAASLGPAAYLPHDDSSYLKVTWAPLGTANGGPVVAFTVFPLSSDRLRLGSLEDLSWGGSRTFPVVERLTPAVRLGVEWLGAYAFVAGKASAWADLGDLRPMGSALGGAGVDLFDLVALEAGGGWFSRGTSLHPAVRGEPTPAYGVSSRVALHWGRSAVLTPDYRTLQRDFGLVELASVGARQPGEAETSALLALEHSFLGERAQSSSDLERMEHAGGQAVALSARLRWSRLTVAFDGLLKEATWARTATFDPQPLFGAGVVTEPELLAGGSAGLELGVARYAVFGSVGLPQTISGAQAPDGVPGLVTVVVRSDGQRSILPPGEARGIYGTFGGVVLVDLGSALTVGGTLSTDVDPNRTQVTNGEGGALTRERLTTWGLPARVEAYGAVLAQMRF